MGNVLSAERQLREYNRLSNAGVVFNLDLSRRTDLGAQRDENNNTALVLTRDEMDERTLWEQSKTRIGIGLRRASLLRDGGRNTEELLRLQIAAPVLHADPSRVSTRSDGVAKACCPNCNNRPPRLSAWTTFETMVETFVVPDDKSFLQGERRQVVGMRVKMSFCDLAPLVDEVGEQLYLHRTAMSSLSEARLIGLFVNGNQGLVANPDFWLANEHGDLVVVGETKSTHNLLLPMTAAEVVQQYNDEFFECRNNSDPSPDQARAWSHVGHAISQLVGYMFLNCCRFGMLTSATRTYFVLVQQNKDGEESVTISNAWFIGQPNYLRAVAAFYHLATTDSSSRLSRTAGWVRTRPPRMKQQAGNRKRAREGKDPGRMRTRSRGLEGAPMQDRGADDESWPNVDMRDAHLAKGPVGGPVITSVEFDEIDLQSPLGYGKQGTTFGAKWRDETVAVKIFDATKPGGQEAFDKEIAAYTHLHDAWGELVPHPKFISHAFGAWFLGMQMAFEPPADATSQDWADVLHVLERKHRFRHLDVWTGERGDDWRNLMVLKDGNGEVHPIVIDLEQYEIL